MADKTKATKEFKMDIDPNFDYILEEQGQTSINLRKISWNERPYKLDIRKWSYQEAGKERAMKGVGLTDEGANELAAVLIETGYGDTKRIMKALSGRDDCSFINTCDFEPDTSSDNINDDAYYDPSELFGD